MIADRLNKLLLPVALRLAMRRARPLRFLPSDDAKNSPNFSHVKIRLSDDFYFVSKAVVRGRGLEGLIFHKHDRYGDPASLPTGSIDPSEFQITRYYRLIHISYQSVSTYILGEITFRHWIENFRERRARKRYDSTLKVLTDRVELLTKLVELRSTAPVDDDVVRKSPKGKASYELLTALYGERIWQNMDHEHYLRDFEYQLESLVASCDLVKIGEDYAVAPNALHTLASYAVEQRRHHDQVRQSRNITVLTAVLAVAAIAQIAISLFWK